MPETSRRGAGTGRQMDRGEEEEEEHAWRRRKIYTHGIQSCVMWKSEKLRVRGGKGKESFSGDEI